MFNQMSKIVMMSLGLAFCSPAMSSPPDLLGNMVSYGPDFIRDLSKIDENIDKALQILEGEATSSTMKVSSLNPLKRIEALDTLAAADDAFADAQQSLSPIASSASALRSIVAKDQIRSLSVVLRHLREIETTRKDLTNPNRRINTILGSLKESRFIIANVSGNFIFTLQNFAGSVEELPLGLADYISGVQILHQATKELYVRAKGKIDSSSAGFGDRFVSCIEGASFGTASNPGPSPFSAQDALKYEQNILQSLSKKIHQQEVTSPLSTWLRYKRKGTRSALRCSKTLTKNTSNSAEGI